MPARIFGPPSEEVTLRCEKLHNQYSSPNVIRVMKSRRMRRSRLVAHVGEVRNAYRIFARRHKGTGPLRRTVCRRKCDMKIDFKETGC